MDELGEEIGKGFLRGLGYLFAEIFYGTICYWVGWPICKIVSLGKYPSSNKVVYLDDYQNRNSGGFWCSGVGFLFILFVGLYFVGFFK